MSGLLERIARRRRASASRRLGPPASLNGTPPAWNGAGPAVGPAPGAQAPPVPEEAIEEAPATEEAPPAPEEAPAAPPQPAPEPEPTEPEPAEPAPVEPPAAPPEPSPGDPSPAEPPPAESPPGEPSPPTAPTFLDRGRIRRRARYLLRLREVQLRDIGGFVLELHRFRRERPDLLQAKLEGAASTERELRALERALNEHLPLGELRQAGIGGACSNCGAVYGSADRYCAWCGNPLPRKA